MDARCNFEDDRLGERCVLLTGHGYACKFPSQLGAEFIDKHGDQGVGELLLERDDLKFKVETLENQRTHLQATNTAEVERRRKAEKLLESASGQVAIWQRCAGEAERKLLELDAELKKTREPGRLVLDDACKLTPEEQTTGRALALADMCSDIVWGGERGWEGCSDEQFRHLKLKVRSWAKAGRFAHLPWWRKDALGWPIERIEGRGRFWWGLRLVFQNVRKLTG